ncbi:MAG: hypothetical protein J0L67_12525 [Cytophagales bacterium]|nr:hypothetical protein [Cytophagales bacterium]
MTRKMIWLAGLTLVVIIVGIFYLALRNTRTDVSQKQPYATWLGELILVRPAFLVNNQFPIAEKTLLVEDGLAYDDAIIVPAGTKVQLTQAIHYRNGVSGVTHSLMIGTVQTATGATTFEYYWGQFHAICLEPPCNYWTYPQAVWQSEADTTKYY